MVLEAYEKIKKWDDCYIIFPHRLCHDMEDQYALLWFPKTGFNIQQPYPLCTKPHGSFFNAASRLLFGSFSMAEELWLRVLHEAIVNMDHYCGNSLTYEGFDPTQQVTSVAKLYALSYPSSGAAAKGPHYIEQVYKAECL